MTPYCSFSSHREACTAIRNAAQQRGVQLFERPWNYHDPDNTAWWLIPSTEWPAYHHGKYLFDEVQEQSNSLFCGVYVEKGIGPELADIYTSSSKRRCIMQTDWAWFRLLDKLQSGKVEDTIKKISSDINSPIELRIDTSYVDPDPSQSFDSYEPIIHGDSYRFQFQSDSSTLTLVDSKVRAHLSDVLSSAGTINGLAAALDKLNKDHWLWVDVVIALQFYTNPPSRITPDDIWNASAVWDRFLCNFVSWL